jgi:hypothetical protein
VPAGRDSARLRVPLQALKVGSHLGRVLVAQGAIFFEALVDDARQFRRYRGIQICWWHRHEIENGLENDPGLSPRNGRVPVAISYSTTPNENRSVRVSNG